MLKKSTFEINAVESFKDKKASKFMKKKIEEENEEVEEVMKSAEDYIEDIICRNKLSLVFYPEFDHSLYEEEVVIKIRHQEDKVYLLQYILQSDQEVTWLSGSKETEAFFNSKG